MADSEKVLLVLGEIKGELRQISSKIDDHSDRMNRIDSDIERAIDRCDTHVGKVYSRLNQLEKKQYTIVVIASALWGIALLLLRRVFDAF